MEHKKIHIICFRKVFIRVGEFSDVQIADESITNKLQSFCDSNSIEIVKLSLKPAQYISIVKIRSDREKRRAFLNHLLTSDLNQFLKVTSYIS